MLVGIYCKSSDDGSVSATINILTAIALKCFSIDGSSLSTWLSVTGYCSTQAVCPSQLGGQRFGRECADRRMSHSDWARWECYSLSTPPWTGAWWGKQCFILQINYIIKVFKAQTWMVKGQLNLTFLH